ncbi:MAG: HlyD family efflux transporter periplasmic adaptor subunit [Jiangellaceae bacterium]
MSTTAPPVADASAGQSRAGLFREQARGRGAAAERLDERVRIVAPRGWLALTAAASVMLAGLAWGFLGSVDRETTGIALITHAPFISEVESHSAGVLSTDPLAIGAPVTARQVIAQITDADGLVHEIRSPIAGLIDSWVVARDEFVGAGERLALIEPDTPLVAYLFVSAADGKRITAGMPVRISPGGTSPQEDGLLEGRVQKVLPYPVDTQRVALLTVQPHLVEQILQDQSVIELDVVLDSDPGTPSGFRWTNGTGPSKPITGGTIGSGSVIIGQERPISLLLKD